MIEIALYQPDIPQNTGTILRLGACLGMPCHVIGPAGFDMSDRALRRAGLDYLERAQIVRHASWELFRTWAKAERRRAILMTTRADTVYTAFDFTPNDILLFGRESAGAPDEVHAAAAARLAIPMAPDTRSLNLATAVAMTAGEALRQTDGFPIRQDMQAT